jgi:hypothetical protein
VKRLVSIVLFLAFAQDEGTAYARHMAAPLAWVYPYLLEPFLKVRPFDVIMLVALLAGSFSGRSKGGYVVPMKGSLWLVIATTVLWFAYGVATGGDSRFASWQTYRIFSTILLAFTVATTFRTVADFRGLAKWLLAAAIYRAIMCWISYFTWARDIVGGSGEFMTTHDDTVGWVVAVLILTVDAVHRRSVTITLRNAAVGFLLIGAIQWNSRRLAWVSLAMGLAMTYALFPPGPAKRRINRGIRYALPILLLYVIVGWDRQGRIFLPLRSLSSVSTQEDGSTLARNAENLGLILTANSSHSIIGTGYGKAYIPLTTKYDIGAAFELWPYIPHNSILGLLAFTGILGFAGFWLAIPTAVFLNARVALLSQDQKAKGVGIIAAAQLVVCANQLYADMGIFDVKPMCLLGVSYGIALRLPALAGVWSPAKSKGTLFASGTSASA